MTREVHPRLLWASVGPSVLSVLASMVVLNAFAAWFVSREVWIYEWDRAGYWLAALALHDTLVASPGAALRQVLWSLSYGSQTLLHALPVALAMQWLGDTSRATYVLLLVNGYAFAFLIAFHLAYRATVPVLPAGAIWVNGVAPVLALCLFPALLIPVLMGMPDIGGAALVTLVIAAYWRSTQGPAGVWMWVACGVALAIAVLFRRWYAYWAVAFIAAMLIDGVLVTLASRRVDWRSLVRAFLPSAVSATVFAATLALLAWPRLVAMVTTDHSDRHLAYQLPGGWSDVLSVSIAEIGMLPFAVAMLSAVLLMVAGPSRRFLIVLVAHSVLMFVLFADVQRLSPHHWYLFLPTFALLTSMGLAYVLNALTNGAARGVVAACSLLLVAGIDVHTLGMAPDEGIPDRITLLPSLRYVPPVRGDLAEIERLSHRLESLQDDSAKRLGVYVAASSYRISGDVLANAWLSRRIGLRDTSMIMLESQVDRRDGFPVNVLGAQIVVVAEPVQLHLRPDQQQVVVQVVDALVRGENIGRAYRRLPDTYRLDGGVQVSLFERMRAPRADEIAALSEGLRQAHPDSPFVFQPPSNLH